MYAAFGFRLSSSVYSMMYNTHETKTFQWSLLMVFNSYPFTDTYCTYICIDFEFKRVNHIIMYYNHTIIILL